MAWHGTFFVVRECAPAQDIPRGHMRRRPLPGRPAENKETPARCPPPPARGRNIIGYPARPRPGPGRPLVPPPPLRAPTWAPTLAAGAHACATYYWYSAASLLRPAALCLFGVRPFPTHDAVQRFHAHAVMRGRPSLLGVQLPAPRTHGKVVI